MCTKNIFIIIIIIIIIIISERQRVIKNQYLKQIEVFDFYYNYSVLMATVWEWGHILSSCQYSFQEASPHHYNTGSLTLLVLFLRCNSIVKFTDIFFKDVK